MSKQVISLAQDFDDIQVPKVYERFKTRKDVLLRMTGSTYNITSNKDPLVIVFHDSAKKNEGLMSTILFLDDSSRGLYFLGDDERNILESDDAPAAPEDDLDQVRHVFKFNQVNESYSYIGLFEAVTNFVDKDVFLWRFKEQ